MFCKDKWVIMQLPLQLVTSHLLQLETLLFHIRTMPNVLNDIDHLSLYRFILSRTSIDYISDLKKSEDARWRISDLALKKAALQL